MKRIKGDISWQDARLALEALGWHGQADYSWESVFHGIEKLHESAPPALRAGRAASQWQQMVRQERCPHNLTQEVVAVQKAMLHDADPERFAAILACKRPDFMPRQVHDQKHNASAQILIYSDAMLVFWSLQFKRFDLRHVEGGVT